MTDALVVLCTVPRDFDAEALANELVDRSLAACVQVGPAITSVYRWKGAVEKSDERLVLIKTRSGLFAQLEEAIKARHPYDVPEIVALEIRAGHAPYLDWIIDVTTPPTTD